MQARAVLYPLSLHFKILDERMNKGGAINCGQGGSFYCGFSSYTGEDYGNDINNPEGGGSTLKLFLSQTTPSDVYER